MQRAIKLSGLSAIVALIAVFGLFLHNSSSTPVSAQVPVTNCATLGGGGETCTFSNPVAINSNTGTNATITIAVTSPAGVTITTAGASDTGGHSCVLSSGAGTTSVTLTCGVGLNAGGSISVTFSQALSSITATVTYNANQTAQSALTASCSTVTGTGANTGNNCVPTTAAPGDALGCNAGTGSTPTSTWTCTNTTTAAVTAGNSATVNVNIINAPNATTSSATNPAGTCALVTTLPTLPNNVQTLTYVCGSTQSIPAGTSINVAGNCSGTVCEGGREGTNQNVGCAAQAQPSACAQFAGPSSQTINFQNLSVTATATATSTLTATPTPTPSPTPTTGCATAPYVFGWNLLGGPSGTALTGASVPIYTLQATDTTYEIINSNVISGSAEGFWAYFGSSSTVSQPCVTGTSVSTLLPANHYLMAGNPFNRAASISSTSSATFAITFNTASNSYGSWVQIGPGQSMPLAIGQGAFVFSSAGGALTTTSS